MILNDYDKKILRKGYDRWQAVIELVAPECPFEIGAIAFRESIFDPKAERYESAFHEEHIRGDSEGARKARRLIQASGYQEHKFAISWGIMQITGLVAYERGYRGEPEALLNPEASFVWGTIHFKWLWERFTNMPNAIAAYNWGSPQRRNDGSYRNQKYVDYVVEARDVLQKRG